MEVLQTSMSLPNPGSMSARNNFLPPPPIVICSSPSYSSNSTSITRAPSHDHSPRSPPLLSSPTRLRTSLPPLPPIASHPLSLYAGSPSNPSLLYSPSAGIPSSPSTLTFTPPGALTYIPTNEPNVTRQRVNTMSKTPRSTATTPRNSSSSTTSSSSSTPRHTSNSTTPHSVSSSNSQYPFTPAPSFANATTRFEIEEPKRELQSSSSSNITSSLTMHAVPPKSAFSALRPILRNYCIAWILSIGVAVLGTCISAASSHFPYKVSDPTPELYFFRPGFTNINIMFNVFGLLFFTVFQFYVFNGGKGLYDPKYLVCSFTALLLFVGIPVLFTRLEVSYYFYLIDVLLIVTVFCGITFMIGYFGKEQVNPHRLRPLIPADELSTSSLTVSERSESVISSTQVELTSKSQRERIMSGVSFTVIEVIVSATALAYGMFLMTVYTSLSDTGKVAWRLLLHPLYFEVFMMLPVHYLVARKMRLAQDNNILYSLSVVHAQSHISTLGRMMFSTLESLPLTVMSVICLNIGKFGFRLSSPYRNTFVLKLLRLDSSDVSVAAGVERQRYIVSAAIQTEMIVENACAIIAGLTMYFFSSNKEIFMFPYPSKTLTLDVVIFTILVQLLFAIVFDILTLFVAQRYLHLPILATWNDMWQKKYRYFGFLLYGLLTMGVIGILYMGFKVQRVPFCTSESVCSCAWLKWMDMTCPEFVASTALGASH